MIVVLVIRLRVEYVLFGDRQIRELMLHRHSLTALSSLKLKINMHDVLELYITC